MSDISELTPYRMQMMGRNSLYGSECLLLHQMLTDRRPRVIVEIGAREGTSTLVFGKYIKNHNHKAHLFSIEPLVLKEWKTVCEKYCIQDYVTMIQGCSPWIDHKVIPKPIDFLFIDGNHNTQYVLRDYLYWIYYMRHLSKVVFHDACAKGDNQVRDVVEIIERCDNNVRREPMPKTEAGLAVFTVMKMLNPVDKEEILTGGKNAWRI